MTNAFETTKTILQSRTVWANTIGLVSLGLSAFGYGTLDVGGLTDALLQTVTAGSFTPAVRRSVACLNAKGAHTVTTLETTSMTMAATTRSL